MRIFKIMTAVFFVLFGISYYCWSEYYAAEFMPVQKAEKRWGKKALDAQIFRSVSVSEKASMAVDIVKRNLYVGQSRKKVREELGDPDSYFFSDTIYAYKIMNFPGAGKEEWHLVFIPDKNLEKIKEVKIHKKCCYKDLF